MDTSSFDSRDYSIDNMRFILIFSVVFAHLLEVCTPFGGSRLIYNSIYSFHMPVFIFLFGYNVKYSPKKIVYRWCFPYVIFQCAYILFSHYVLESNSEFQFTTPYWLLWYMLVCIYYQLLLPIFDTKNKNKQILMIIYAFLASFLIGYEKTVGYYMSLSRFWVFQPWFLLGYYCKKNNTLEKYNLQRKSRFVILVTVITIFTLLACFIKDIPRGLLYGSYSYYRCEGTWWMRGIVSIISFCVILFLCVGMRPYLNRKIGLITTCGQNTWPVFLLHGFIIKIIPYYFPHFVSTPWRVIILTCAIVIFTGNKVCNKIIYYACFSWLEHFSIKTAYKKNVH